MLFRSAQQHKDDVHAVALETELDDLLPLDQVGGWQVHLLPPRPDASAADTTWQPLRPDWFGYRRLDRRQDPSDVT